MKFLRILALLAISLGANAQATLPTFWDFSGTEPTGWTQSGTSTYSSPAYIVAAPSCKLSATGQYVQINVADVPGKVKYYIGGATGIGGTWSGTFSVQESVAGSSWTDLKTYTALQNTGLVADSVTPNANSRYIRFYFTAKQSGSNVALDNVSIALPPLSPVQEINLVYNGNPVASGSTIYINSAVSTATQFNLTVENVGTANQLTLSLPSFSGPQQADYTVNTYPSTVNGSSSDVLTFTFNPPAAGTRLAQLSIPNNDSSENPYIINVYGTGGGLATEPTTQASGLTFPIHKSFRVKGQFSAASPAVDGGYLVLRKDNSAVTELPVDGQEYSIGDYIGSAQVVSKGQLTSFIPKNIKANTTYHFAVFSYNGQGTSCNYATTSPLTGSTTTLGAAIGNYYSGIDKNQPNFVTALHNKINTHNQIYYDNYDETMVKLFAMRDTTNGQHVLECVYSGYKFIYDNPFVWGTMSREHTFCHNWMPTNPADNPELPEYDDYHNLYPTKQQSVNDARSDHALGIVVSSPQVYLNGKVGYDANGVVVYEPRDEQKGRAARALLYMSTCYTGVDGNSWIIPYNNPDVKQDINLLKQWHFQYPPNDWDIARNDFVDSLQHNRNPFVDSVDFVCYINFYNMSYVANPGAQPCLNTVDVNEDAATFKVAVFPVPTTGMFNVSVTSAKTQATDVLVTDYAGRIIMEKRINVTKGSNLYEFDLSAFDSGIYNVSLRSDASITTKRLVVVH